MHFNPVELVIILLIVLVLFGAGRVGKIGGELGTAIREFKRGLNGEDEPVKTTPTKVEELPDQTAKTS